MNIFSSGSVDNLFAILPTFDIAKDSSKDLHLNLTDVEIHGPNDNNKTKEKNDREKITG